MNSVTRKIVVIRVVSNNGRSTSDSHHDVILDYADR